MTKPAAQSIGSPRCSVTRWLVVVTAVLIVVSMLASVSVLANQGELEVIAILGGEDVSLAAQVIIMGNMMPAVMEEGSPKKIALPAGTYDVMIMLVETEAMVMPAQAKVTLAAGESKTLTVELQSMGGFMMPGMPDMSEMPEMPGMPGAQPAAPAEPEFDPEAASTNELLTMLQSDDEADRQLASKELGVAYRRRDAAADLLGLLEHREAAVRSAAMDALVRLGREQPDGKKIGTRPIDDVMDRIVPYLGHGDLELRLGAAAIVADAWYFPHHSIPLLVQGLEESHVPMRIAAAKALAAWGQKSAEYSPQLMSALPRALNDAESQVRVLAAEAMRWVDYDGGERAAALAPALFDGNADVQIKAAQVIEGIGAEAVIVADQLIRAANDGDGTVRQYALKTMGHFPSAAVAPHVSVIAQHLTDTNDSVRTAALEALWAAGPTARPALDALSAALLDPSWRVAQGAARIIQQHLAPDAIAAIPNLAQLLQQDDRSFREAAATAAFAMAAMGEAAVPTLIELLSKEEPTTLYRAATALNTIGPDAAPAVPRLEEILHDDGQHDEARRAAYFALISITGEEPEM